MKCGAEDFYELDEKERKNAYTVYQAYMNCDNVSDYNSKIKKLSVDSGLSEKYLKGLRETYILCLATLEEKKAYKAKKAQLSSKPPKSIALCDELFSLSDDEKRYDYLLSKKVSVSDLKTLFESYKVNNGKFSSLVDDFFDKYSNYVEELKASKSALKKEEILSRARFELDGMIALGFYRIMDYARYMANYTYGLSNEYEIKLRQSRQLINENDSEEWKKYELKMGKNRRLTFEMMKDKIVKFNNLLKLYFAGECDLDVIDYYLLIGMPLRGYRGLCNFLVEESDMSNINKFIDKYINYEEGRLQYGDVNVINGHVVTDEEREKVYNFLYQYNIPYDYFLVALKKYLKGGLTDYIDVKSKRISK